MPMLDHGLGFGERLKLFASQALITQAAVETLDVSILPWAARFDVGRSGIDSAQEALHAMTDEVRTVVTEDQLVALDQPEFRKPIEW